MEQKGGSCDGGAAEGTNHERIEKWKAAKIKAWQAGGKLKLKFPLREDLERWIEGQVKKAIHIQKARNVMVLGVPRSGTSMLTHAIAQAGAIWKGESTQLLKMEKKKDKNPRGFFELQHVFKLNWRWLHLQGIRGLNYFANPRFELADADKREMRKEAKIVLDDLQKFVKPGKCWVIKMLRYELTHELWDAEPAIKPNKCVILLPFRSPVEVKDSTWDYWKDHMFWKHCILKIFEIAAKLGYSVVIASHRHLLVQTKEELNRVVKALTSLGVPGLDAAKINCIEKRLWRCRSKQILEELPIDFPKGVRVLWKKLVALHKEGKHLLLPSDCQALLVTN